MVASLLALFIVQITDWGWTPPIASLPGFVPYQDRELTAQDQRLFYRHQPFNGWTYELHHHGHLYRLIPYRGGRIEGTEIHWYPDGRRWVERSFKEGVADGEWKMWFSDGKVQALSHYSHGEPDGESWAWNQSGIVTKYSLHREGHEIAYKSWTFDGKPFVNYVYQNGEKAGVLGGEFCKRQ